MALFGRSGDSNRPRARNAGLVPLLSVACYDAIVAVPPDWDQLVAGGTLFLGREYLRLLEVYGSPKVRSRYAILSEDGRPVACIKANIFDVDDDMLSVRARSSEHAGFRDRYVDRNLRRIRNTSLGAFGRRIVLCGNLFSCGLHGVAFSPDEDPARLWPAVTHGLGQLFQEESSAAYLVIKDISPRETAVTDSLGRAGCAPLKLEPSMDLHVPGTWHTYGDYLASLNTKYRKAAKKIQDAVDQAGIRLDSLADPAILQDRLLSLYEQVEQRARTRFGTLQAGYLPALARMAGVDRFRCSVARRGDEVIGFSAVLKDGGTAVVHLVGFDYEENARAPVYLRLLHQAIEDSLVLGCATIHFGRTALEPKARLGAVPTDTEAWVKHTNPVVNRAVGCLLRLVPEDRAPLREPFRKARGGNSEAGMRNAE